MRSFCAVVCVVLLCAHSAAAQNATNMTNTTNATSGIDVSATLAPTAVHTTTPPPLALPWLPSAAMLTVTACTAAEVQAATQCQQRELAGFTGTDPCAAIPLVARCWPYCFCVHSLGYRPLAIGLSSVCQQGVPSCGAPVTPRTPPPQYPTSRARHTTPSSAGFVWGWALAHVLAASLAASGS